MWLGVDDLPKWLLWQPFNNYLLMVIMVWIQVGFAMVVLSAAIKAILVTSSRPQSSMARPAGGSSRKSPSR